MDLIAGLLRLQKWSVCRRREWRFRCFLLVEMQKGDRPHRFRKDKEDPGQICREKDQDQKKDDGDHHTDRIRHHAGKQTRQPRQSDRQKQHDQHIHDDTQFDKQKQDQDPQGLRKILDDGLKRSRNGSGKPLVAQHDRLVRKEAEKQKNTTDRGKKEQERTQKTQTSGKISRDKGDFGDKTERCQSSLEQGDFENRKEVEECARKSMLDFFTAPGLGDQVCDGGTTEHRCKKPPDEQGDDGKQRDDQDHGALRDKIEHPQCKFDLKMFVAFGKDGRIAKRLHLVIDIDRRRQDRKKCRHKAQSKESRPMLDRKMPCLRHDFTR